jgi:hypothetical protein
MGTNQQDLHEQNQCNSAAVSETSFVTQALGVPRVGAKCDLEMDVDVKLVMEFMQENMSASKLVGVAQALATMAPIMWGWYEREKVCALALRHPALTRGSTLQPAAT